MRPLSILTACLVAAALYLTVMEREWVLRVAGAEPAIAKAAADDAPRTPAGAVPVVAVASTEQAIDSVVGLRGQTEAARSVDMMAETTGRVVSPPLRKGTSVEPGEVLCRLDPGTREVALAESEARLAEARAAVPRAEAQIAAARAQLAEAEIGQTAADRLSQDGFASQTRVAASRASLEAARASIASGRADLESARAGVKGAEAAVAAARVELDRLDVVAPFGGVLESDTAELGALMQPGALCATVIQLAPIKLVGFVPETAVDRVRVGAPATARLASGQSVEGEVIFLSRAADPRTRTFRVEVEVGNGDLSIRDGQTAEISVAGAGEQAHLLPQSALTLNDDGDIGVRVVGPRDVARFRPVRLLGDTAGGVHVAGLDARERVIVVGQDYVTDGTPLAVTEREMPR